jgi:uncharacterized membrane protein
MKFPFHLRPLFAGRFLVEALVGSAMARNSLAQSAGYQISVAMMMAVLVLPSLLAGWLAGRNGMAYGLILGALPTIAILTSRSGAPVGFLVVYLVLAVLGGLAGQSLPGAGRPKWRR